MQGPGVRMTFDYSQMTRLRRIAFGLLLVSFGSVVTANADDDSSLRIFGYFQNSFQHQDAHDPFVAKSENSFALQQLNFFMQKDIDRHWSAFVDFEVVNSFSSKAGWGDFSIEEAWVRYRYDNRFNLKLGLLIPTFNHLNEIKNRTPLLPYIIRPIVYEASLAEQINIERIVPKRSYMQTYGFFPIGAAKLDYAAYVGNSPNINSNPELSLTGVDTTNTFLVGGRIGIRWGELKTGFSATYDKDNSLADERLDSMLNVPRGTFSELGRTRLGGDLLYHLGPVSFESEIISVQTEKVENIIDARLLFYYATLGAQVNEQLFVYGSFWMTDEHFWLPFDVLAGFLPGPGSRDPNTRKFSSKLYIPTGGISYAINDRISLKGQVAHVKQELSGDKVDYDWNANYYALGVSVFF